MAEKEEVVRSHYQIHRTWIYNEELEFFKGEVPYIDPNTTENNLKKLLCYERCHKKFLEKIKANQNLNSFFDSQKEPREIRIIDYSDADFDYLADKYCDGMMYAKYKSFKTLSDREIFMRYVIMYNFGGVFVSTNLRKGSKSLTSLLETMHEGENSIIFGEMNAEIRASKTGTLKLAKSFGTQDGIWISPEFMAALPKQEFFRVVLNYIWKNVDPNADSSQMQPNSMATVNQYVMSDCYYELRHPPAVKPRHHSTPKQDYDEQVEKYYSEYKRIENQAKVLKDHHFFDKDGAAYTHFIPECFACELAENQSYYLAVFSALAILLVAGIAVYILVANARNKKRIKTA